MSISIFNAKNSTFKNGLQILILITFELQIRMDGAQFKRITNPYTHNIRITNSNGREHVKFQANEQPQVTIDYNETKSQPIS